jgi:hypothetical protein
MSANARLLELVLRSTDRPIYQTQLLKLAYLADLAAWQVLGEPISTFKYRRYNYGPFDAQFYGAIEELALQDRIYLEETSNWFFGSPAVTVRPHGHDGPESVEGFTTAQRHLVALTVKRYAGLSLKKLLSHVYQTEPMLGATMNAPLPMEAQSKRALEPVGGGSLQRILDSREAARRGDVVSLEDLKKEIFETVGS